MIARPTGLPYWASSPTNIAEPPSSYQVGGWATNEKPPSSYMNFMQQRYARWIEYLDDLSWKQYSVVDWAFSHIPADWASDVTTSAPTSASVRPSGVPAYYLDCDTPGQWGWLGPKNVAAVSLREQDWRLSVVAQAQNRYGGHAFAGFGPLAGAAPIGASGVVGFFSSGLSGYWGFRFCPSGSATPTVVPSLIAQDQLSRLTAERNGATMTVYVGATAVVHMPGVAPGWFSFAGIGANGGGASGSSRFVTEQFQWFLRRSDI